MCKILKYIYAGKHRKKVEEVAGSKLLIFDSFGMREITLWPTLNKID
jgi:hypothetical protein